ncbi:MAG: sulfite exporter TauE/SafE family protein [Gammaproteobacteria bacterium]|nr:sulfite exporter TauE/SafE family protein [Gammaproteobacteria bacterium]
MSLLVFTALIALGSVVAGGIGALTGLGGGVIIVPLLTLGLGVDIRYAVGASLVSVIATSSGAAAAYLRDGYINLRIGMFLEVATTLGALAGGVLATWLPADWVSAIFGVVLAASALLSTQPSPAGDGVPGHPLARRLRLNGRLPAAAGGTPYAAAGVPGGFALMFGAGMLSSLLGIGAGAIKVLALDRVMRLPFKVSTTTSNFMIGVTAAAGAGVYLNRGYIDPALAMPVMLGVLSGSLLGAWLLPRAPVHRLRQVFVLVLLALAVQMLYNGVTGHHA